jgi:hypothetical protein
MSDFLSDLAARSFGSVGAIRPRVASFFEPVQPSLPSLRVPEANTDAGDGGPLDMAESEIFSSRNLRNPERAPSALRAAIPAPSESLFDSAPSAPPLAPLALPANVPVSGMSEASEPMPVSSPVQVRAVRAHTAPGPSPQPQQSALGPQPEPNETPASFQPDIEVGTQSDRNAAENHEPVRLVPHLKIEDRSANFPMRSGRRLFDEPGRSGAPQGAAESQPAIHVTIGRIEIRATSNAGVSRRAEPAPSPVMSLDEYLRRQAKRGGA